MLILLLTACLNDSTIHGQDIFTTPNKSAILVCDYDLRVNADPSRTYDEMSADFEYLMAQRAMNCISLPKSE